MVIAARIRQRVRQDRSHCKPDTAHSIECESLALRAPGDSEKNMTDLETDERRVRPMTLIEPNAHVLGGHASGALASLARAASEQGIALTLVSLKGVSPLTRRALLSYGVRIVDLPDALDFPSRSYMLAARFFERALEAARRFLPRTSAASQFLALARCFLEAGSLRVGRRVARAGDRPVVVLLTASEALAGTAAALSRTPHVRIVHEADIVEGFLLRRIEYFFGRARSHLVAVCTTADIEARLHAAHPDLRTIVQPFTLCDPDVRVSEEERAPARASLGIAPDEIVCALVGGWWPTKDIDTVEKAIAMVRNPLGLIVAGGPVDQPTVDRMSANATGRVFAVTGQLPSDTIRQVYAACDFTLVSCVRGSEYKESGLVMDAARYGVPLVASDNNPKLTQALAGVDWARTFPTGDPGALAAVLDEVAEHPLARPSPKVASSLGMITGVTALEHFNSLGGLLAPGSGPPRSPKTPS